MGVYSIRTVEFQTSTIQEWDTRTNQGTLPGIGGGRSGGFTFSVAGLTAETVAELEGRLRVGQRMARWRAMELDAVDAYESGRYEDAVILIWTAVETAVKTVPRLAR